MDIRTIDYLFRNYIYNYVQPSSPDYFNRVYLCVEKKSPPPHSSQVIEGFQCYRCSNLKEATKEKTKKTILTTRSTLIPICKWVPLFMDPYLVDYKLKKHFWLGKHTFYQRKT